MEHMPVIPSMKKIRINDIAKEPWVSPKGKFETMSQGISEALGRDPQSTDLTLRHPFDVELVTIPPGKANYPYHSHSAQWEYYQILSGTGVVRHEDGKTEVSVGDAFLFPPGKPHQIINNGTMDLVVLVVADNPIGESCHYPDSGKWIVRSPERRVLRSESLDYFDGEE